MKKSKGIVVLLLTLILTVFFCFTAAVGIGPTGTGAAKHINTGLDLAGGVSITYQVKGDETPSAEDMSDTVYKLQKRVETYSTEAEVYQEGSNRINIDIPGVSDANAILEELGKPGSLIFVDESGNTILTGDQVASAKAAIQEKNGQKSYVVSLTFTEEGAKTFADATAKNIGKRIGIIYDGSLVSYPTVNSAITGGECYIDGMQDYDEAENLAATIRIGSLSLELEELRSNVVGAKLGQEAIATSLKAGAIGFGIVAVFMIAVYLVPGLASVLALCLYVALELVLLSAFEVTLTLPGIAGIILSIGMAVDANVIIFTRIKEEIGVGKTVKSAIKTGFSKALSAIVDGNVTTLIAAVVLFWRGSGTVKGFASTLALGIVLSMFTALFVTKAILNALYNLGLDDPKFYGVSKEKKAINFLGKKNLCFIISCVVIVAGWVMMGVHGAGGDGVLNYSMEFKGGTSTNVTFNEDYTIEEIENTIVPVVADVIGDNDIMANKVEGTTQITVKTRTLTLDERDTLEQALVDQLGADESSITSQSISSTVSNEMRSDAIVAVIVASICMLIYIWFRFKDIRFGASAIIALLHDVLVVLAVYSLLRISVGNTFIACMLTIIGYSVNDTIVIFDRIRENLGRTAAKQTPELLAEVANKSLTQTLSRSINTSLTTFIMVFMLFLLGVASIREFALPLMAGLLCGAYSSICIATELWYIMRLHLGKNRLIKK